MLVKGLLLTTWFALRPHQPKFPPSPRPQHFPLIKHKFWTQSLNKSLTPKLRWAKEGHRWAAWVLVSSRNHQGPGELPSADIKANDEAWQLLWLVLGHHEHIQLPSPMAHIRIWASVLTSTSSDAMTQVPAAQQPAGGLGAGSLFPWCCPNSRVLPLMRHNNPHKLNFPPL